jgi:hypothetical protein
MSITSFNRNDGLPEVLTRNLLRISALSAALVWGESPGAGTQRAAYLQLRLLGRVSRYLRPMKYPAAARPARKMITTRVPRPTG